VQVVSQADIVAHSLQHYLQRHPEIESQITKGEERLFYTTDSPVDFNEKGSLFFGSAVQAQHVDL
jgi:glutamate racemase